jgi:predicted amidohydrolase YtcJ
MGQPPARVLLRGGCVYSPEHPSATAMLTVGETVAWIGDEGGAAAHLDEAELVVELDGGLVTPGFVDAHVHLAKTGLALQTLDLSNTVSVADALDRLAEYATRHVGAVLVAHGWDESRWPDPRPFTGAELDRAVGDRVAYVSRVDSHSAVVSSALLDLEPAISGLRGWRGDGGIERDAHHAARGVVDSLWSDPERRQALLLALREAARVGITSVHEVNAPHISPYDDARLISALRRERPLPEVVAYWGALLGGEHADAVGLAGFAGDLCIDGAIGSRTAALHAPYQDADGAGHLYLDDVQVRDHVVWCTERGLQAGFHVIGDRGVDTAVSGLEQAAAKVGTEQMFVARHRLEHVEMPTPSAIALLAALHVVASVQPMFDAAWGAPGELYEKRLGTARSTPMNPFASMRRAGVTLAFGSDSPVTAMGPWAAVRAAVHHHHPAERLTVEAAFEAHTRGGHRARRADDAGTLVSGAAATYAIWEHADRTARDGADRLPALAPSEPLPSCVRTVVAGTTVFDAERQP